MITVVGWPAAACTVARPLTASPRPPVRAKGQYSAVRWVTPMRSLAATGAAAGVPRAARRGRGVLRCGCFEVGVVMPWADRRAFGLGSRAGDVHRVLHLLHPAVRDAVGVPVVEQRDDFPLEQPVQLLGVGGVVL